MSKSPTGCSIPSPEAASAAVTVVVAVATTAVGMLSRFLLRSLLAAFATGAAVAPPLSDPLSGPLSGALAITRGAIALEASNVFASARSFLCSTFLAHRFGEVLVSASCLSGILFCAGDADAEDEEHEPVSVPQFNCSTSCPAASYIQRRQCKQSGQLKSLVTFQSIYCAH
jgi:hypothetical protein